MTIVIVPNYVRDAINKKLNTAIAAHPEAEKDREVLYSQLLDYFFEHDEIPDFQLQLKHSNEKGQP